MQNILHHARAGGLRNVADEVIQTLYNDENGARLDWIEGGTAEERLDEAHREYDEWYKKVEEHGAEVANEAYFAIWGLVSASRDKALMDGMRIGAGLIMELLTPVKPYQEPRMRGEGGASDE